MKKQIDKRITELIRLCKLHSQRGVFLIIGDNARNQVINLVHLISQKNKILWCYKNDLGFSSHQTKRLKQFQSQSQKGLKDSKQLDNFELFLQQNEIQYVYYKEAQRILGTTNDILILQDFESLTPNLLCQTIETIKGGGFVFFLMNKFQNVQQLYDITMDVNKNIRDKELVKNRFTNRFLLKLHQYKNIIMIDDELNIINQNSQIDIIEDPQKMAKIERLKKIKDQVNLEEDLKQILDQTVTIDQGNIVLELYNILQRKYLKDIVSLTAGRGRGKSASLGLLCSLAVKQGLSNIFICAPYLSNVKTVFEFVLKGLQILGFQNVLDYQINYQSENEIKFISSIQITKTHSQIIQFISSDQQIVNSDLLLIDEAASIPLQQLIPLLENKLIIISSTMNGYEGTGKSLQVKLLNQIKRTQKNILTEFTMEEPIRYNQNDMIENLMETLMFLNSDQQPLKNPLPSLDSVKLYMVNKDVLFSNKKTSEFFLQKIMQLFIQGHYKNTPNDLMILSDSPQHQLFVLTEEIQENKVPDILCAIQVCLEGNLIDTEIKGLKPQGDLVPWVLSDYFQYDNFSKLLSLRIVRIACHYQAMNSGYGSKAIQLLKQIMEPSNNIKTMIQNNSKQIFNILEQVLD